MLAFKETLSSPPASIPTYERLLKPLLEFASDGREHSSDEAVKYVMRRFGIPEQDAKVRLRSGRTTYLRERVSWAITHLVAAGLLKRTKRATFRITHEGLDEVKLMPPDAGWRYLCKYESFRRFNPRCPQSEPSPGAEAASQIEQPATPEEVIEQQIEMLNRDLPDRLLQRIKDLSPEAFERLIIKVISALGYGGDEGEMAEHLGGPGDQGVDGEILEDKLGFERIYLQAKKYDKRRVGVSQVRDFVGALSQKNATKGILITTSRFTKGARRAAEQDRQHRVVLLDGDDLVKLMIEHNIGVRDKLTYTVKDVDEDFFQDLE